MPVDKLVNGARLIGPQTGGEGRNFALAGNFVVEWAPGSGQSLSMSSGQESMFVFPAGGGTISGTYGDVVVREASVVIVPPGEHRMLSEADEETIVLATDRPDLNIGDALNPGELRDPRIAPVGRPPARKSPIMSPQVMPIASIVQPEDNKRIRFVQSETMSINIVLYDGPRGTSALSPHAHDDIEQGTLAIAGDYVHHLRRPWGRDAADWVEDVHCPAGARSLLLIPPEIIHTTEGVGGGAHFLLDIFAPPRRDFIAKGWMANAADYSG